MLLLATTNEITSRVPVKSVSVGYSAEHLSTFVCNSVCAAGRVSTKCVRTRVCYCCDRRFLRCRYF